MKKKRQYKNKKKCWLNKEYVMEMYKGNIINKKINK